MKKKSRMELADIQIDKFNKCFQQWKHWLNICIALEGQLDEGVTVVVYKKLNISFS